MSSLGQKRYPRRRPRAGGLAPLAAGKTDLPTEPADMRLVGARIRARARELRLDDDEVARRAGVPAPLFADYVHGRTEPDNRALVRICRALATSPDVLLGFEADPLRMRPEARPLVALLERLGRGLDRTQLQRVIAFAQMLAGTDFP